MSAIYLATWKMWSTVCPGDSIPALPCFADTEENYRTMYVVPCSSYHCSGNEKAGDDDDYFGLLILFILAQHTARLKMTLITSSNSLPFSSFLASVTVIVYDLLLLLPTEVNYVWLPRPVHPLLPLFALNRYLPLVNVAICMHWLLHEPGVAWCHQLYTITGPLAILEIFTSQLILMIRTYAIWDRHRMVLWCFIGIVIFCFTSTVVMLIIELRSQFVGPTNHDCLSQSSSMPNILYIPVVVSETIIASLTLFKGVQHLRHSSHPFVTELYVSGMFFYLYLFFITLANILLPMWAHNITPFLTFFQTIFHSILSNRILLLIVTQKQTRRRYPTEELYTGDVELSDITSADAESGNDPKFLPEILP
ncbi:hypothetical protein F5146DRAFT_1003976 [Armillaria mellea]|nr:hypothetical protein F5146DRAFT_1003976 [Armillaria mellea]